MDVFSMVLKTVRIWCWAVRLAMCGHMWWSCWLDSGSVQPCGRVI